MHMFLPEDLTWALMQEREAEARRAAAHTVRRPAKPASSVRSALARRLVGLAVLLDGSVRDIVVATPKRPCSRAA